MEVTLTKISQHGKTKQGTVMANNTKMNITNTNWGMYVVVWGQGSKRQSRTMHCSESAAEAFKNSLKD